MKKFISTLLVLLAGSLAPLATAQTATTPFTAPEYYASSFNLWSINGQSPNTYVFQGRTLCNANGQNLTFFAFSTTAPVLIADANTTNNEVVTPSAIVNTAGSCGVTVSPSHTHFTFQLRSGTGGLQESINTLKDQAAWPVVIDLDRNWFSVANNIVGTNAGSIIGAATGDATVILKDITTAPSTAYVWSGTAFTSTNNTQSNTAPTIAAGSAAGTSPTLANAGTSTQLITTANVTSGTATTTGTLFTETYSTVANGGFHAAGSCSVLSTGTNSFTAFTVATSTTGSSTTLQRVLTVTATSAPTASTAYVFSVNCK